MISRLKEVFDPDYKPDGEEEEKLFEEKKCFTYAVLNWIIQMDEGKAFVRQHEKDYNAQEVYRKLLNFATKSTAAKLAKDGLVKFLTTTKLDSCWNGLTVGFILHWCEQMRLLDDMSPDEDRFRDGVKKRMMESAVEETPELATVKDIDTNQAAIGGELMSFSQYKETLIAAATRRDKRLKPTLARNKRVVQNTNSSYGGTNTEWFGDGYLDDGMNYFDMGNIVPTLVHRVFQRGMSNKNNNQSNRLPREIWDKVGPELQAEVRKRNKTKAFKHKGNQASIEVNLHEIDDHRGDIDLEDIDNNGRMTDGMPIDEGKIDENGEESNLILAHITKQRATTSPHDIRNILASAHKQSETNNHFQQGSNNSLGKWGEKVKNSVFIDGKHYIQADNHRLHYNIAAHENRITRISSLIDRD